MSCKESLNGGLHHLCVVSVSVLWNELKKNDF